VGGWRDSRSVIRGRAGWSSSERPRPI